MSNAPSQHELKALLSDLVRHGSQIKIANILGVTPGEISHRFNPDHECKLRLAEGLREAWAIAGGDPEAFRGLRAYLDTLFDSWELPESSAGSLPVLAIAADQEADDVIRAFVGNKPIHEQRKEATEAIAALKRYVDGLDRASSNVKEICR